MMVYECEQCGACCRYWIIEADCSDVLRCPAIAERCNKHMVGHGAITLIESAWSIAVGSTRPCPFLQADNRCGIYGLRPDKCMTFPPGCQKCTYAREVEGLPPLEPREVEQPTPAQAISAAFLEAGHGEMP